MTQGKRLTLLTIVSALALAATGCAAESDGGDAKSLPVPTVEDGELTVADAPAAPKPAPTASAGVDHAVKAPRDAASGLATGR